MRFESSTALIGGLLLVLTLLVCYICVVTFTRSVGYDCGSVEEREGFMSEFVYRPACGNRWLTNRQHSCVGSTRGEMPSIDDTSHRTCSGATAGSLGPTCCLTSPGCGAASLPTARLLI